MKYSKFLFLLIAFNLLSLISLEAQNFEQIPYHGSIADANGTPYTGTYDFSFRLIDPNNASIWSSGTISLDVNLGSYSVILGSGSQPTLPASIWKNQGTILLEISFDDGTNGLQALTPNVELMPTPYSIRSKYADNFCGDSLQTQAFQLTTGAASGAVLVSDSFGYASWSPVAITGGNTLDEAYAEGTNRGDGRIIVADSGAVEIHGNDNNDALFLDDKAAVNTNTKNLLSITHKGTGKGAMVNMRGNGVGVEISNRGTGSSLVAENLASPNQQNSADIIMATQRGTSLLQATGGRAGLFQITQAQNDKPALEATTVGLGHGIYGKSNANDDLAATMPTAGVAGYCGDQTNARKGVAGLSNREAGVWGKTHQSGSYLASANPSEIIAGVVGNVNPITTIDNFALAGLADGYGTGAIGIGAVDGHGIIGITGKTTIPTATHVGIWGLTREQNWTDFKAEYPLKDQAHNKGNVAVLGQALNGIGSWGESQGKIGVVATLGSKMPVDSIAPKAALFAQNDLPDAFTAAFVQKNTAATMPALQVFNQGDEGALLIQNPGDGISANVETMNPANASPGIRNLYRGMGDAIVVEQEGGAGTGLKIFTLDPMSAGPSIVVENDGMGDGIMVNHTGGGGFAAAFIQANPANPTPAVTVDNGGGGGGIRIENNKDGNGLYVGQNDFASLSSACRVSHNGLKEAVYVESNNLMADEVAMAVTASGVAGVANFFNGNVGSTANGVEITNLGAGNALSVENAGSGQVLYAVNTGASGRVATFANSFAGNADDGVLITTNSGAASSFALHVDHTGPGKGILISSSGEVGGDFDVSGLLTAGAKLFRIDHPFDPTNQYLNHISIESDEMLNVYSGNISLDANGEAVVQLPAWFEEVNTDYRYQLTAIGGFAQLYIAQEIAQNQFKIAGGSPNMKVSWQITALRNDKFAQKHRVEVEQEKPAHKKGSYLHPDLYGEGNE